MSPPDERSPAILITGFGPFPGAWFNPTGDLVRRLVRLRRPGLARLRRAGHVFRTSYAAVEADLPDLMARHRPDAILMFGLAARTPWLRIEACARNVRSGLIADAAGRKPSTCRIAAGGPSMRPGRAPVAALVAALRGGSLPARLSRNAGRYLCNFVYWRALETGTPIVLFVHVPQLRMTSRPVRALRRKAMTGRDLEQAGEIILRRLVAEMARRRPSVRPAMAQGNRYGS